MKNTLTYTFCGAPYYIPDVQYVCRMLVDNPLIKMYTLTNKTVYRKTYSS